MLWFKKGSRNEQKRALERVETQLGQLEHTLQELIKQGTTYDIVIEELNIHDPSLDNLTFRFDKLDVKEVSGALNLGNNFGVRVQQGEKKEKKNNKSDDGSANTSEGRDGPAVHITRNHKQPSTQKSENKKENNFKKTLDQLTKEVNKKVRAEQPTKNNDREIKVHIQPIKNSRAKS